MRISFLIRALSILLTFTCFACNTSKWDEPPMHEALPSNRSMVPSPPEMGESLGFGAAVEEGEGYILFMDEYGYEQEVLKEWSNPPPHQPPVAQIVGRNEASEETFSEGIIHNTTWPYISVLPNTWLVKYPPVPTIPTAIGPNKRTVRFLTGVMPTSVDVVGFNEPPVSRKYSASEMAELESYEYTRSNRNPGEHITLEGYIEYHKIPSEVLRRPYIIVSARWAIPPSVVDGKIVPKDDSKTPNAHWLFYIADKE